MQDIRLWKPPAKFPPTSRHARLLRVKACVFAFKSAHNSNDKRLDKNAPPMAPSNSVDKQMRYLGTSILR